MMESLEKHVREILRILEKEYVLYKKVFKLVKEEQNVLINANIERLEQNLFEQKSLTDKINKIEAKRLQELEVIAIYLGTIPEKMKLDFIAKHVEPDLAAQLLEQEKLFKAVLKEILQLNKSNKFLINRSLQFIDQHIQVFFGTIEEKGVYNPKTAKSNAAAGTSRLVNWKA